MKHSGLFILLMVILSSCGVTQYTTYADITLLNNNGEVIRQWDNSALQSTTVYSSGDRYTHGDPLKNSGLNFTDKDGETHYISGGIIIVDNIKTCREITEEEIQKEIEHDMKSTVSKDDLIVKYNEAKRQYNVKKTYLRTNKSNLTKEQISIFEGELKNLRKYMSQLQTEIYSHLNEN